MWRVRVSLSTWVGFRSVPAPSSHELLVNDCLRGSPLPGVPCRRATRAPFGERDRRTEGPSDMRVGVGPRQR
jgi:hypothetical protein